MSSKEKALAYQMPCGTELSGTVMVGYGRKRDRMVHVLWGKVTSEEVKAVGEEKRKTRLTEFLYPL